MSWQATRWALEQQIVKDSTARHVLVCLAHYAGDNGENAFPSTATLVKVSGLSERTVRSKLDLLETAGAIVRGDQAIAAAYIDSVDRRPVCYDLCVQRPANPAPRDDERGANGAPRGDVAGCSPRSDGVQLTQERGAADAPNQSYESSINHLYAPPPEARSAARASRLRNDWELPKAWGLWALEDADVNRNGQWTEDHVRLVADKFRDHWTAAPGRQGLKLDWLATWRNWCRDARAAMPAARGGVGGNWRATDELALAKALEVGIDKAHPNESRESWHARISTAIENGGKPPAPRQQPLEPTDVAVGGQGPKAAPSDASRSAVAGARALLKRKSVGGGIVTH